MKAISPPPDTDQFDLYHRAARCAAWANDGNAVVLFITAKERELAQHLVGSSPVIVATGKETIEFLQRWVPGAFGSGHGGRRRAAE